MKVINLNPATLPGALFEAARTLKSGGTLVYPTDTVYGLGGNALDAGAVKKVFAIKARPAAKGIILLVESINAARKYAYIDLWTESVLAKIWPGPVSVVLSKKEIIPEAVSGSPRNVALRVPDTPFLNQLLKTIPFPLMATSANVSGETAEPRTVEKFLARMERASHRPDLVIDGGELEAQPSTVLDLTDRRNPIILRHGAVTKQEIDAMIQLGGGNPSSGFPPSDGSLRSLPPPSGVLLPRGMNPHGSNDILTLRPSRREFRN